MRKFPKPVLAWRRHLFLFVVTVLCACLFTTAVFSSAANDKTRKLATLTGDHQKQQFAAAKHVEVTETNVADDIFTAGQHIRSESVSAKNIIAAGMSLSLQEISAEDLILAGGQMDLSGNVTDDIIAAVCPICLFGGHLHVKTRCGSEDDARLAGRDIVIDGWIGGDLYVTAQQFKLSGEIMGNARVKATHIVLAPGARINGDLIYASRVAPEILDGAVVTGQIHPVDMQRPFAERSSKNWIWHTVAAVLGTVLALILLGAALQLAMPGVLSRAAATVIDNPWASLGRGLVLALLLPGAAALLMVTVIGVPIGLVAMAAYFVLFTVAFVAISYRVGLLIRSYTSRKDIAVNFGQRILWTTTGILTLVVASLVPFVGWAFGLLAMIVGLGAVFSQIGPLFRGTESTPLVTKDVSHE